MTWYADNLYLPATDRVLRELWCNPTIRPYLYYVADLSEFPWHRPDVAHTVGPVGLAVVRPIADTSNRGSSRYQVPGLSPNLLCPNRSGPALKSYVADDLAPKAPLLQFLHELSITTESPVLYYSSFMWGGDVEFEASWVFAPKQFTYVTRIEKRAKPTVRCIDDVGRESIDVGDALQKGLLHLGVDLPTGFFALHTRGFPWEDYRVLGSCEQLEE